MTKKVTTQNQSNNSAPVNVAVVGMGYWGKNLVRNFHELGALAVVCDSREAVETESRAAYPKVRFCREFHEVLVDPMVHAVALATPAVSHYEMAKRAIEAGKDVYVEKPLAIEVKQGRELVEMAEANGRILMVGHILRYHPAVLKLQELIKTGGLGKIHYLYSNRLNIGKIRTEENILWSFAPHDVSVMLSLLNEIPTRVTCQGGAFLGNQVYDVTMSQFNFASGVQAHIYVSWLHPVKEQRLVVVGSEKMAVFDDTIADKLVLYPHKVEWKDRIPTAIKAAGEVVPLDKAEPLKVECQQFIDSVRLRQTPPTDGAEGLRVLSVLDACQRSLFKSAAVEMELDGGENEPPTYFAHETARVDKGSEIGKGSKVWHFSHVMSGAHVGEGCVIGQNVNIDGGTTIGNNVKIQNNVSVYTGTTIEDDVFLGPSCVLTNVTNPRSQINRHSLYEVTRFKRGCTIGANSTIVCGITIGRYAFVGAGAVVTRDVPDYALVTGNPARQKGWMSRHGHKLHATGADGIMRCPETGYRYEEVSKGVLRCLDLDEEARLPAELSKGTVSYRKLKSNGVNR